MIERRKHRRLKAQPAAQYRLHGGGTPSFAKAVGADISLGGLRLMLKRVLNTGAELDLKIELSGTGKTLSAQGQVSWQRKLKDGAYETGVKFTNLTGEDIAAFTEFVFHEMHKRVRT